MFLLCCLGLLLLHGRGALASASFAPHETNGWSWQQTLCHEETFELVYGREGKQASLMLRPPNLPGFGRTPSFSLAYVKPDHATAAQEQALQKLASGVLVWLSQRDKGQWRKSLPCQPPKNLSGQWGAFVSVGGSPRHHQPVNPWVKRADVVAIVGVVVLFGMLLFQMPTARRWWRRQPLAERRVFAGLLLVSVLLRLGPGAVADELFHGPWRVEDARELPLIWGYYPPGVKAPLWWLMQVLPPSMDLFWNLNRVLGVVGAIALGLGVWRGVGPRAGCFTLMLMGLHPWAAFYARTDADTAAAMAGMGLFVLSLTLQGKRRWVLVGMCAWWMAQQRPELLVLWPLLFLRRRRDSLWALVLAMGLHTPWLVAGFWHKAVAMASGVNPQQQGWPVLREFLGLTLNGPPGAPAWPWLLWWGAALWGALRMKKAAVWGALAGAVLLAVLLSSHGAGNALLGNLRYAMVFFPLLAAALAAGWSGENKKALTGVCGLLLVSWLGWFQAVPLSHDLQVKQWHWLSRTSPRLGQRCTVFLLAEPPGRGPLHEAVAYGARPLWPLTWPPQNCTLRVLAQGEEPREGWLYLGPACYEHQRGQDARCATWRHRLRWGAIHTTLPVHPRLWWPKGQWDEGELEIGFYPFSALAAERR